MVGAPVVMQTEGEVTPMNGATRRDGGWKAPVWLPDRLEDLHGPETGLVQLPLRIHSSGAGPAETFDLADDAQRMTLYQIVLENGRAEDICRYIHAEALRRFWDHMWLSPHVRRAWEAAGLLPAGAGESR